MLQFEFNVPDWANYVGINEDGTVDAFEEEPEPDEFLRRWNNPLSENPYKEYVGMIKRVHNLSIKFPNWRSLKFEMKKKENEESLFSTSQNVVLHGPDNPVPHISFTKYHDEHSSPSGQKQEATSATEEPHTASDIVTLINDTIIERGKERDTEGGERSFEKARDAWWSIFGDAILERGYPLESEICYFMAVLKLVRSTGGNYRFDDHLDGAAYAILGAEAAEKENSFERPRV